MEENKKDPGDEKLLILPLGEESRKITQVISNDTARHIIELLADAPLSASDIAERLHAPLTTVTYNLENLESVGLIKVERIKYSEKGREVKVYAPVKKLIVVVPEKTDRKSVTDLLRKYLGVILAAVLASSMIEFFTRKTSTVMFKSDLSEAADQSAGIPPPLYTQAPSAVLNETARSGEHYKGLVPSPTAVPVAIDSNSVNISAAVTPTSEPVTPVATTVNDTLNITGGASSPLQPQALEKGGSSTAIPDILARISDFILLHPGIVFLLGCLFIIILFVILDYRRKKKAG
ncbi:MAG: helix-turn-helix domain-containing protein [Candidatus Methanoperedens sp.]|nr:helix-turn-helix domain-containing protein [Candidatus Methanoperedens sp.]